MIILTTIPTNIPVRKVTIGALSGAIVSFIVLILNTYVAPFEQRPISGEISGAATTIVSFVVSYLVSPDPREAIAHEEGHTVSARN